MKIWWETKALPWLRKYWQWILLPIGLLMLVAKVLGGRRTSVVASELTGAAKTEHEVNEEAAAKVEEARAEKDEATTEAKEEHDQAIRVLTEEQQAKARELADDPTALNDYLKGVGKQVRK